MENINRELFQASSYLAASMLITSVTAIPFSIALVSEKDAFSVAAFKSVICLGTGCNKNDCKCEENRCSGRL